LNSVESRNDFNVNFRASCNRICQQSDSWKIVYCLRWNDNNIPTKISASRTGLANSSKEGTCRTHERPACSQQEDLESNMCVCECKH